MKRIISLTLCVLLAVQLFAVSASANTRMSVHEVTPDEHGTYTESPTAVSFLEREIGSVQIIRPELPLGVNPAGIELYSSNKDILQVEPVDGTYWKLRFLYGGRAALLCDINGETYSMECFTRAMDNLPPLLVCNAPEANRSTVQVNQFDELCLDIGQTTFYIINTDAGWTLENVTVTPDGNPSDLLPSQIHTDLLDAHVCKVTLDQFPNDADLTFIAELSRQKNDGSIEHFTRNRRIAIPRLMMENVTEYNGHFFPSPYTGFGRGPDSQEVYVNFFTGDPSQPVTSAPALSSPSLYTVNALPDTGFYALTPNGTAGYSVLTYEKNGVTYYGDAFVHDYFEKLVLRVVDSYNSSTGAFTYRPNGSNAVQVNPDETVRVYIHSHQDESVGITGLHVDDSTVSVRELGGGVYELTGCNEGKTFLYKLDGNSMQGVDVLCGNVQKLGIYSYHRDASGNLIRDIGNTYTGVGEPSGNTHLIRPILSNVDSADIELVSANPRIAEVVRIPGTADCWEVRFKEPGETQLQYTYNGITFHLNAHSHLNGSSAPHLGVEIMHEAPNGGLFPFGIDSLGFSLNREFIVRPFCPDNNADVELICSDSSVLQVNKIPHSDLTLYSLVGLQAGFVTLTAADGSGVMNIYCGSPVRHLNASPVTSYAPDTGALETERWSSHRITLEPGETRLLRVTDENGTSVSGLYVSDPDLLNSREIDAGLYEVSALGSGSAALCMTDGTALTALDVECGHVAPLELYLFNRDDHGNYVRQPNIYTGIGREQGSQLTISPVFPGLKADEIQLVSEAPSIVSVKRNSTIPALWDLRFVAPGQTNLVFQHDGERYTIFVECSQRNVPDSALATLTYDGQQYMDGSTIMLPYNGKAQKPNTKLMQVLDEHGNVIDAKDYTIKLMGKFTNVTDESYILVTGKGHQKGHEFRVNVHITPMELTDDLISLSAIKPLTYKGTSQTPKLAVKFNGKAVKEGTDFRARYVDEDDTTLDSVVDTGTYHVVLDGCGNYAGSKTFEDALVVQGLAIKKAKMTGFASTVLYVEGAPATQNITLTYNNTVLTEGVDYAVSYVNNEAEGKATMTVVGLGNFFGTEMSKTFKIAKVGISKAKLAGLEKSYTYTGEAIEPAGVTLTYTAAKGVDPEVLVEGRDYTVRYEKNTSAGSATIFFDGCGSFTGTLKKAFKITPVIVADTDAVIVQVADGKFVDSKTPVTPEVTVRFNGEDLILGTDYTVKFSNNKAVGYIGDAKAPTATISFKGNFKGKIVKTFNIEDGPAWE